MNLYTALVLQILRWKLEFVALNRLRVLALAAMWGDARP